VGMDDVALAADALRHLNASYHDNYDLWMEVGFALRGLGEVGLALWKDWSRQSDKYQPGDCEAKWATMSAAGSNGVSLGSLFHWGEGAGWKRPRPAKPSANGEPNGRADGGGGPEPSANDRDPRPIITLTAELHVTVDQSAEALSGHGDVFSRVGALVQV